MKTFVRQLLFSLFFALSFHGCIADEALNAECDILEVDSEFLATLKTKGILIGNPIVSNNTVEFTLAMDADRSSLAPSFQITDGATLCALNDDGTETANANGIARDFSTPRYYVVHSEDGNWSKTYRVSFTYSGLVLPASFEHMQTVGKYGVFYEIVESTGDSLFYWASGNAGYSLTGQASTPENFPSVICSDGYVGSCVKLSTLSTGTFGKSVSMPIAAGSVFIGEFRAANALTAPLKATRMGLQLLNNQPKTLTGYYKYTSGDTYMDKDYLVYEGVRDTADIYAVVYEVDPDDFESLDGSNCRTSDRIVCIADYRNPGEPQEWTRFEVDFKYLKEFDRERLTNNGYAIAIVASSSRYGDIFEGSVGSVLYLDEVDITWIDND